MMASTPEPSGLNSHHRDTLKQIFQHPAGHNIEWHAVVSLLEAVASVEELPDGRLLVSLGGETETLDRPKTKDIGVQSVVDLRRMLTEAGYGSEAAELES
jgi:hypothetical protein